MLEKEVLISATDDMGFGSFANTHILRVKNEDGEEAGKALKKAGIKVIPYENAAKAYAEDLAEKTLAYMVDKRAEEQAYNNVPMTNKDRILADEAIFNARSSVGEIFYEELLDNERDFAEDMIDEIMESAHKNISVEESVKLGLLTPCNLAEKLEADHEDQLDQMANIEDLMNDESEKRHEFGGGLRGLVVPVEELVQNHQGRAYKKTKMYY